MNGLPTVMVFKEGVEGRADLVAWAAHGAKGQKRRFTGAPYITHPRRVATRLYSYGIQHPSILAAALLHDVVEDTRLTLDDLRTSFYDDVVNLVEALTKPEGFTRDAAGRQREREWLQATLRKAPVEAVAVKMADRVDNLEEWELTRLPIPYIDGAVQILSIAHEREEDAARLGPNFHVAYRKALAALQGAITDAYEGVGAATTA